MNQQTNIENYRRSFNIMSRNPGNTLKKYLKEHNINKIELLFEIGLNKELVKDFNYSEIEKLVSLIISDEEFPVITRHNEVSEDISIYNPKTNHDLKIGDNFITFDLSKENHSSKEICFITYTLDKENTKRINTNIEYSLDENSNFVNNVVIKIGELKYLANGEVLDENNCEIIVKNPIFVSIFKSIYKAGLKQNIVHLLNHIMELIKDNKLRKEDIEIKLDSLNKSIN